MPDNGTDQEMILNSQVGRAHAVRARHHGTPKVGQKSFARPTRLFD